MIDSKLTVREQARATGAVAFLLALGFLLVMVATLVPWAVYNFVAYAIGWPEGRYWVVFSACVSALFCLQVSYLYSSRVK